MDTTQWASGFPHDAPERPLSIEDAHLTMQRHLDCRAENCPRKAAAFSALVKAGSIKVDASRSRQAR